MSFDGSSLDRALSALGELLEARGMTYRLAAVGGGAMLLLDLISRPTKDLDLVGQIEADDVTGVDPLPAPLKEAITDVARALGLASDWLNPGPASLLDLGLPAGFVERGPRAATADSRSSLQIASIRSTSSSTHPSTKDRSVSTSLI
jgi:hypothetical protein